MPTVQFSTSAPVCACMVTLMGNNMYMIQVLIHVIFIMHLVHIFNHNKYDYVIIIMYTHTQA